jgi:acetyltransferase
MRIPGIREDVVEKLKFMFEPDSVAVVGASRDPEKIGYQCLRNLVEGGYEGRIYPINPNASEIMGLKCFPSVLEVPGEIDLALIVVPAKIAKRAVEDCARKGVKAIAMITAGFSEIGNKEGEDEIVRICRENGIPLLGPNIVGIANSWKKCNASFCQSLPYAGKTAFISQSGALAIALIGWTWLYRVGLSSMASIGNKADVDFSELILYFGERDERTNCIAMYIEGLDAGPEFMEACRRVSPKKPLVALKAGKSERGVAAAASHTGSLAGAPLIYSAAFKQCGVIEVNSLIELFDSALALSLQPPMLGDFPLIITNGGGAGVCATDAAERYGIPISDTPPDLRESLRKYMPEFGSPKNPVDITGMGTADKYEGAIREALAHPGVNGLAVLYCHTAITSPMGVAEAIYRPYSELKPQKPIVAAFIGGSECEEASSWLKERGIPTFPSPERAMRALSALRAYGKIRERFGGAGTIKRA